VLGTALTHAKWAASSYQGVTEPEPEHVARLESPFQRQRPRCRRGSPGPYLAEKLSNAVFVAHAAGTTVYRLHWYEIELKFRDDAKVALAAP
jgi:hypothetical protein